MAVAGGIRTQVMGSGSLSMLGRKLRDHGIEVVAYLASHKDEVPACCDAVLLLADGISHRLQATVLASAKGVGVKAIMCSRKWAFAEKTLREEGLLLAGLATEPGDEKEGEMTAETEVEVRRELEKLHSQLRVLEAALESHKATLTEGLRARGEGEHALLELLEADDTASSLEGIYQRVGTVESRVQVQENAGKSLEQRVGACALRINELVQLPQRLLEVQEKIAGVSALALKTDGRTTAAMVQAGDLREDLARLQGAVQEIRDARAAAASALATSQARPGPVDGQPAVPNYDQLAARLARKVPRPGGSDEERELDEVRARVAGLVKQLEDLDVGGLRARLETVERWLASAVEGRAPSSPLLEVKPSEARDKLAQVISGRFPHPRLGTDWVRAAAALGTEVGKLLVALDEPDLTTALGLLGFRPCFYHAGLQLLVGTEGELMDGFAHALDPATATAPSPGPAADCVRKVEDAVALSRAAAQETRRRPPMAGTNKAEVLAFAHQHGWVTSTLAGKLFQGRTVPHQLARDGHLVGFEAKHSAGKECRIVYPPGTPEIEPTAQEVEDVVKAELDRRLLATPQPTTRRIAGASA